MRFRWNAEILQDIRFAPWKPIPGKTAQVVGRDKYITQRMIDAHGPVAHWSFHGGLGGSGRRDHGR